MTVTSSVVTSSVVTSSVVTSNVVSEPVTRPPRTLIIDFLYLDLTTCTRCRGTEHSLQAALAAVGEVLTTAGVDVEVRKFHIRSEAEARARRFVSSPTIRINGADIACELRESSCGSEACVDGCGDHIACRVWLFGGRAYTEPPADLIVDAILRHVPGQPTDLGTGTMLDQPYRLPANLQRFFAGRSAPTGPLESVPASGSECCPPAEHDTCCAPEDKPGCCTETVGCGCR